MLIALTGGIGSGKSTVAEIWGGLGATIVDADVLAREVVAPGSITLSRLVELVGRELLNPDGTMNRRLLAERIFGDPILRAAVEGVMHPAIQKLAGERIAEAVGTVVYVIPLLIETDSKLQFDAVVSLAAPEELRISRLVAQRGMERAEALARIRAQATDAQRGERSDVIIDTDCSLDELRLRATQVYQSLIAGVSN